MFNTHSNQYFFHPINPAPQNIDSYDPPEITHSDPMTYSSCVWDRHECPIPSATPVPGYEWPMPIPQYDNDICDDEIAQATDMISNIRLPFSPIPSDFISTPPTPNVTPSPLKKVMERLPESQPIEDSVVGKMTKKNTSIAPRALFSPIKTRPKKPAAPRQAKRQVYLIGPMKGGNENEAAEKKKAFADMKEHLERNGYKVYNPWYGPFENRKERKVLNWLAFGQCDMYVTLPGWEDNERCKLEVLAAKTWLELPQLVPPSNRPSSRPQ